MRLSFPPCRACPHPRVPVSTICSAAETVKTVVTNRNACGRIWEVLHCNGKRGMLSLAIVGLSVAKVGSEQVAAKAAAV